MRGIFENLKLSRGRRSTSDQRFVRLGFSFSKLTFLFRDEMKMSLPDSWLIAKGTFSKVYRVGSRYAVKIIPDGEELELKVSQLASDLGIGPKIYEITINNLEATILMEL
uniref:Uncharacterized protein n=1 Tax=viral metagenome TaxID=1070528 RepID=A0A6C0IWX9_9ZZZZ